MFGQVRRALANSPPERDLALRLSGLPPDRVVVAGEGIDLGVRGDGAAFRARHGLSGSLLLCAGRHQTSKNVLLLLSYVREYQVRHSGLLTLLLTGRDPLEIPPALGTIVRDLDNLPKAEVANA